MLMKSCVDEISKRLQLRNEGVAVDSMDIGLNAAKANLVVALMARC